MESNIFNELNEKYREFKTNLKGGVGEFAAALALKYDVSEKIHIIRHGDRLRIKLKNTMKEYQECSNSITGQTGLLIEIFFWNIMQRVSQLLVSFMIFMAVGEGVNKAVDVSVIQCFVAMGSNCVPIPGAMGVADYIMIDGFKQLVGRNAANMELLCRGMTFYGSVITSAVIILIGYIIRKKVAK